jgi:PIN domain nuclease of toxin-antitoxin system
MQLFQRGRITADGDPADRLLAATAKINGLTLVTSDRRLLASREFSTLANVTHG